MSGWLNKGNSGQHRQWVPSLAEIRATVLPLFNSIRSEGGMARHAHRLLLTLDSSLIPACISGRDFL
jgi:hypothetical protein